MGHAFADAKIDVQCIHDTGRKVTVPICDVIEVRDGKVYAEREYFDMQQLGVAPAAVSA